MIREECDVQGCHFQRTFGSTAGWPLVSPVSRVPPCGAASSRDRSRRPRLKTSRLRWWPAGRRRRRVAHGRGPLRDSSVARCNAAAIVGGCTVTSRRWRRSSAAGRERGSSSTATSFLNAEPSWWREVNEAVSATPRRRTSRSRRCRTAARAGCGCRRRRRRHHPRRTRSSPGASAAAAAPDLREWLARCRAPRPRGWRRAAARRRRPRRRRQPRGLELGGRGDGARRRGAARRARLRGGAADAGGACAAGATRRTSARSAHHLPAVWPNLRNGDEELRSSTTARPACRILRARPSARDARERDVRARRQKTRCTVPSRAACASTPCPSATTSARGCGGSTRWPAGGAAHESYFGRITHGPAFAVEQAARPGVEILKAGKVASVQSAHASAKVSYC